MVPSEAACYVCHAVRGAGDTTLVHFYAAQLPTAKSQDTPSASYRKERGVGKASRSFCIPQRRLSASNSSSVRGQSAPNRRERLRSASTLPPVWQRAQ